MVQDLNISTSFRLITQYGPGLPHSWYHNTGSGNAWTIWIQDEGKARGLKNSKRFHCCAQRITALLYHFWYASG